MSARPLILGIQLIGVLLIVAALTSGFFVLIALVLAVVLSPIQSIAASCAQDRTRIVAFIGASIPSLLMGFSLVQRQEWIEQCRVSGCSGIADGTINALPALAIATVIPLVLCLITVIWNGLGSASLLGTSTRIIIVCASLAPVLFIYGVFGA